MVLNVMGVMWEPLQTAPLPEASTSRFPPLAEDVAQHIRSSMAFHTNLQSDHGHWPGDFGGPMWLTPGPIIALYTAGVADQVFSPEHIRELVRYLRNHQNKDGGFPMHIEGQSTMLGTGFRCVSSFYSWAAER
jgi:cycloartenol synthase